jgi:hypothetical protein
MGWFIDLWGRTFKHIHQWLGIATLIMAPWLVHLVSAPAGGRFALPQHQMLRKGMCIQIWDIDIGDIGVDPLPHDDVWHKCSSYVRHKLVYLLYRSLTWYMIYCYEALIVLRNTIRGCSPGVPINKVQVLLCTSLLMALFPKMKLRICN